MVDMSDATEMNDASSHREGSDGPTRPSGGPLDDFLCFSVYSTGLAFNRIYKPLLDKLGLTYVQYLVMVALMDRDAQSVSDLGDLLFLELNTLTPLLKRLEASGLLTRTRDPRDERVVRITLTERGRMIGQEAACVPEQIFALAGLSLEEIDKLRRGLSALRATLRAKAEDQD